MSRLARNRSGGASLKLSIVAVAGVAVAVSIGGPGATFWMILAEHVVLLQSSREP